jgi:hypothetical protein
MTLKNDGKVLDEGELQPIDEGSHGYRHLFLAACVIEFWISRLGHPGELDECLVCGACRRCNKGALVSASIMLDAIKAFDVMLWELPLKHAASQWSIENMLRFNERHWPICKGDKRWCCQECLMYTRDAMVELIAKVQNVSRVEARAVLESIKHE